MYMPHTPTAMHIITCQLYTYVLHRSERDFLYVIACLYNIVCRHNYKQIQTTCIYSYIYMIRFQVWSGMEFRSIHFCRHHTMVL